MFSHNFTLIMMCDEPTYCARFPVPVTLPDYPNISWIVPLFSKDGFIQPATGRYASDRIIQVFLDVLLDFSVLDFAE